MKILILNTSERVGGAAVAANRLMRALNKTEHEARMLVRDKQTGDGRVFSLNTNWGHRRINCFRFAWERLMILIHNRFNRKTLFALSLANTGINISKHPLVKEADIIHLHWINQGFLSLKNIRQLAKLKKPIVWTMHDMWPCTAICHYAGVCNHYRQQCRECFFLPHSSKEGMSAKVFRKKQKYYQRANITFVTCSEWLNKCATSSTLLTEKQVVTIHNSIDISLFAPSDKISSRKKLGLPIDKKLILFSAANLNDGRKGFNYLAEAVQLLDVSNVELVLLGDIKTPLPELPLKVNYIGFASCEADMAMVYNTIDVYVTPSLEDNLPNTIMEAMACGTPCVGFNTGGIPEMIDHKINGYVAAYKSADDLATGIQWVLSEADYMSLSAKAVEKVRSYYSEWIIAGQYVDLYTTILPS